MLTDIAINLKDYEVSKIALTEIELIELANKELLNFPGYIEGMKIEEARMERHILVMYGYCFMDNEKPTAKTAEVLPIYNEFGKEFSEKYTLC